MRKACVIGWPVEHSRSPLIHNFWIEKYGVPDALYERLAVEPAKLADTIAGLNELGYVGANVTVPHKEAAFALLTRHDALAKRLRAVNTIVTTDDGLEGRNTDGYGFIANLKSGATAWNAQAAPAVMIGAGGAARAIAASLEEAGVPELRIVNRTKERAETLASEISLANAQIYEWDELPHALQGAGLLVNTTTRGMKGENDLTLDLSPLAPGAVVTDIVYTPLETGLLRDAKAAGLTTVDGLGMLLHQAVPGFEAWFGVRPEVTDELRAHVLADMGVKEK